MSEVRPSPGLSVLILSGSSRRESLNGQLAALAARVAEETGATVDLAHLGQFEVPGYDGDDEATTGMPAGAVEFRRRLLATDALILAAPEYNGAMPGVLKNLIDWTSRFHPHPFQGRHTLLLSASPSQVGGNRGLWSLRVPLEYLGAHVFPDMFSLAMAHKTLLDGDIADPALRRRFDRNVQTFLSLAEAAKHYDCMKRTRVDRLGAPSSGGPDRFDAPAA